MLEIFYAGAAIGTFLFYGKIAVTFFFPRWLKRLINYNNFTLLAFDAGLGIAASTALANAHGIVSVTAGIMFGVWSVSWIIVKKITKTVTRTVGDLVCG